MMTDASLPEVFIDLNGAMLGGYLLTHGSYANLVSMHIDRSQAIGQRFRFVAPGDGDEESNAGDLFFDGILVEDVSSGALVAVPDQAGIRRRSRIKEA